MTLLGVLRKLPVFWKFSRYLNIFPILSVSPKNTIVKNSKCFVHARFKILVIYVSLDAKLTLITIKFMLIEYQYPQRRMLEGCYVCTILL